MILKKIQFKIFLFAKRKLRDYLICKRLRKTFSKNDISIISSNCIGGVISHDLGIQFNSPTVNLYIEAKDFIKFLSSIKEYLQYELDFIDESTSYPIAQLHDIKIYFVHYKNNEEAREKWNQRKNRINEKNIYVMMCERDGCTYDNLKEFDKLPYKNKVVFTHIKYPQIKSSYYIRGFENENELGDIIAVMPHSIKRYYDQFNYADWLKG